MLRQTAGMGMSINTDDHGGCTMVAELYHATSYGFDISNLNSSISTQLFPSLRQPYCNF